MKDFRRRLFSLSDFESNYFNDMEDKFELVGGCPKVEENCKKHLCTINKNYLESSKFLREKNYPESIEALKHAFYVTSEFQESTCSKCAELFRSSITESLEYILDDLHKMSTGLFRNKRFLSSYELAGNVLDEFKKAS